MPTLGMPALFLLAGTFTADAGNLQLAAIVEDVQAPSTGLAELQYLEVGREVALAPGESLSLSYPSSCMLETITGGRVKVGESESAVEGGAVDRKTVACDAVMLVLTPAQGSRAAGEPVRGDGGSADLGAVLAVFGLQPVFDLPPETSELLLERVDWPNETYRIPVTGRTLDLAGTLVRLQPLATYRATANGRSVEFYVEENADAGPLPIVSRLVRF